MSERRTPKPSPLAGEGAERRRREAGEGSPSRAALLSISNISKIRARDLRSRMTDAERKLWFALRDRRFANFKFRRQVPIGRFIADFVCFDSRIVIEVDGGQHANSSKDTARDQWFAGNDFLVLRFWNNEVLQNLEGVLLRLLEVLQARAPSPASRLRRSAPSPARGEGFEQAASPRKTTAHAKAEVTMSGEAHPKQALRPYLPADAPLLAEIFRASIEELGADDYSASQQEAWSSLADDEGAFAQRLSHRLTLVATMAGSPVGFGALEDDRVIDMLYVHPAAAGEGVGSTLCDALEKLAGAHGAKQVSVDASDTARTFFERRGYVAQRRNTVSIGGEWLANTTMTKQLTGEASAR